MEKVIKQFSIELDAKRSTSNRDFEVVDGDNGNVLEVTLTDDGQPVDLDGCFILAIFSKSNGRTAAQDNRDNGVTVDTSQGNRLYIELYTTSFAPGLVECELQVYSGEEQRTLATTAKFNFMCRRGIANRDTIAETDEWPVLIEMLERIEGTEEELHILNEETAQSAAGAHTAANRANAAAQYAEEINADMEDSEGARKQAEQGRVMAENARAAEEDDRLYAENERQGAEIIRQSAESSRVLAESERIGAEAQRLSAESERVLAEAIRNERSAALHVWEDYDNTKAYVPLNKVSFGGSSYMCVEPVKGIAPPNSNYWLLIAAKGADGDGAGDMLKSTYDKNDTGVVDDSERLGGRLAGDYLTEEADPTVPSWAKEPEKPTYTAEEVGAASANDLSAHTDNTDNPHNVTAEQIGAASHSHAGQHAASGYDPVTPQDIGALALSGGTMTGELIVRSAPAIGTSQARNIYCGTSDLTAGSSSLATGVIYMVYE